MKVTHESHQQTANGKRCCPDEQKHLLGSHLFEMCLFAQLTGEALNQDSDVGRPSHPPLFCQEFG